MITVQNVWNGKRYSFNESEMNDTPMWNKRIHDNSITPDISHPLKCGYCNVKFMCRCDLFYHLGFMNIDIRNPYSSSEYCNYDMYDDDGNMVPTFPQDDIMDLLLRMKSCNVKRSHPDTTSDVTFGLKKMKI